MWMFPILIGITLILFGVLVLVMPELLAFLVAFGVIFAGFSLIGLGLSLKRGAGRGPVVVDWSNFKQ